MLHQKSVVMEKVLRLVIANTILLICAVLFCACYHPIDDINKSFGISIDDKVQLKTSVREEYGGINSDYTCIYIYSITDTNIIAHAKDNFQTYCHESDGGNTLIEHYLINTGGYCKILTSNQEEKCLYIDTVNNNILFCIVHQ